jgi:hypothetical protein
MPIRGSSCLVHPPALNALMQIARRSGNKDLLTRKPLPATGTEPLPAHELRSASNGGSIEKNRLFTEELLNGPVDYRCTGHEQEISPANYLVRCLWTLDESIKAHGADIIRVQIYHSKWKYEIQGFYHARLKTHLGNFDLTVSLFQVPAKIGCAEVWFLVPAVYCLFGKPQVPKHGVQSGYKEGPSVVVIETHVKDFIKGAFKIAVSVGKGLSQAI